MNHGQQAVHKGAVVGVSRLDRLGAVCAAHEQAVGVDGDGEADGRGVIDGDDEEAGGLHGESLSA